MDDLKKHLEKGGAVLGRTPAGAVGEVSGTNKKVVLDKKPVAPDSSEAEVAARVLGDAGQRAARRTEPAKVAFNPEEDEADALAEKLGKIGQEQAAKEAKKPKTD